VVGRVSVLHHCGTGRLLDHPHPLLVLVVLVLVELVVLVGMVTVGWGSRIRRRVSRLGLGRLDTCGSGLAGLLLLQSCSGTFLLPRRLGPHEPLAPTCFLKCLARSKNTKRTNKG